MDRRELVKIMSVMVGGTIALPESVFARIAEPLDIAKAKFFTGKQRKLVAAIAECIIPKTDTPGAIEAGVPAWIEILVQDCLTPADQKIITDGLASLEADVKQKFNSSFAKLTVDQQIALLTEMEKTAKETEAKNRAAKIQAPRAFIRQFKDLTKFSFVNSEVGGTQAFEFIITPGRWDGAMELKPGQKAYSF